MDEENLIGFSSLSLIENNLWLGNLAAATNVGILQEKKVQYLVTVNSFSLPKKIRDLSSVERKYIKVFDSPEDDLLSHFEQVYEFIENGLKKGVVLVHCYCGVSRSATVILSYLMKKKCMILSEAIQYVKSKCETIEPNPGFLDQLKLYEIMNFTLDKNNVQYKMFRLHMASIHMKVVNCVPEFYADVIQDDPLLITGNADDTVYKCRKCRRIVARGLNEMPHMPNDKYSWNDSRLSQCSKQSAFCRLSYFVEPLVWMDNVNGSLEEKLYCPNKSCNSKLGSFNWASGIQCPCGTTVEPGFYLIPSKVDKHCMATGCVLWPKSSAIH